MYMGLGIPIKTSTRPGDSSTARVTTSWRLGGEIGWTLPPIMGWCPWCRCDGQFAWGRLHCRRRRRRKSELPEAGLIHSTDSRDELERLIRETQRNGVTSNAIARVLSVPRKQPRTRIHLLCVVRCVLCVVGWCVLFDDCRLLPVASCCLLPAADRGASIHTQQVRPRCTAVDRDGHAANGVPVVSMNSKSIFWDNAGSMLQLSYRS